MALQSVPPVAVSYGQRQRRERNAALYEIDRLWGRVDTADITGGFLAVAPELLEVANTAQARMGQAAVEYVPEVLEQTGQSRADRPRFTTRPDAMVGTAGSGVGTEVVAYGAVTRTKAAIETGMAPDAAKRQAGQWLTAAFSTVLADTGRITEGVAGFARPVGGYVRMLNGESCGRCIILAGKFYRKNAGFQRHPNCFPAGVVVSGPAPEAATRRWYEGELTVIRTASGQELPATGNHPILTDQGWVPANLIKVGDNVVSSALADGAVPLVVPDEKQAPALIENVWGSDSVVPLGKVPTTAEDFHGDGGHGEVDVVLPDGFLWDGRESVPSELIEEVALALGVDTASRLTSGRPGEQLLVGVPNATDGFVSSGGLAVALGLGHLAGANLASLGVTADRNSLIEQSLAKSGAADPVAATEAVLTLARLVGARDLTVGQDEVSPRWDAPAGPLSMDSRAAYASRGHDLRERLSGQVSLDRVVKVERTQWSGHVYNLTSSEGWFSANGFIVSNCDCRHIPSSENIGGDMTTSPTGYLDELDDDRLAKALGSKSNARAYKDGADPYQLVNAYRKGGVRTAQQYGRNVKYTTEGTTRFGVAGRQMREVRALSQAGVNGGSRRVTAVRMMPESIYAAARDQAHADQMLRDFGWIVNR